MVVMVMSSCIISAPSITTAMILTRGDGRPPAVLRSGRVIWEVISHLL
jgi:hypothetical protein